MKKVKVRFDGVEYEIEVKDSNEENILERMNKRLDSTVKENEKLKGENSGLKNKVEEATKRANDAENPEKLKNAVNVRLDAISKIKAFKPEIKIKDLEDKSLRQLRLDCIGYAGKEIPDKNASDEFISGAFGTLDVPTKRVSVGGPIPKSKARKDSKNFDEDENYEVEMTNDFASAWEDKE